MTKPKKRKVRIIERVEVDGRVLWVIQQPHWLLPFFWVDASYNSLDFAGCRDWFTSLEEAKENLCYFDGSKPKEKVVEEP